MTPLAFYKFHCARARPKVTAVAPHGTRFPRVSSNGEVDGEMGPLVDCLTKMPVSFLNQLQWPRHHQHTTQGSCVRTDISCCLGRPTFSRVGLNPFEFHQQRRPRGTRQSWQQAYFHQPHPILICISQSFPVPALAASWFLMRGRPIVGSVTETCPEANRQFRKPCHNIFFLSYLHYPFPEVPRHRSSTRFEVASGQAIYYPSGYSVLQWYVSPADRRAGGLVSLVVRSTALVASGQLSIIN
jgi:hypothetical protein